MKPVVSIYCEGVETKVTIVSVEKDKVRVLKSFVASMVAGSSAPRSDDFSLDSSADDISFDSLDSGASPGSSDVSALASEMAGIKLSQFSFIPVITEPSANFHVYEGEKVSDRKKQIELIANDILKVKGILAAKDSIDYVDLNDKAYLCVFIESSVRCAELVNSLASLHGRRYYKIDSIKSAEVALANYVSKTTKFFPEDYTLIIHIGKEASKLIFLEGQKLKHIGTTLDVGTKNLHTYDVYFSKILLEMENGGVPRLDNVVLCGDDRSENLMLSFYGTFPEANVIDLKFDSFDLGSLGEESQKEISTFSIPLAAVFEYQKEESKEVKGINILPKYIQENQKFLQFGWHSYVMLAILFVTTFFYTFLILSKFSELSLLDKEIARLISMQKMNEEIISQITPLSNRIANFDNTQSILDSAAVGTGVWSHSLDNISSFMERRRNFWITFLESTNTQDFLIRGYTLSRSSLTEFARENDASILKNVLYEPLRDKNAFSFTLNAKIKNKPAQ